MINFLMICTSLLGLFTCVEPNYLRVNLEIL